MEKNTKNKGTFKYGRGAAAAVILTAGAAMLSGCVAVEASKPASGAVVVSDAAQKEGTLTVVSSESVVVTPDMAEVAVMSVVTIVSTITSGCQSLFSVLSQAVAIVAASSRQRTQRLNKVK